ncbi:MAG: hypothetical protein M1825_001545 [Sarcosagium campestre]|nr:MAG: hypothetical protein M1825_001545 [Sarcosagium campestre]
MRNTLFSVAAVSLVGLAASQPHVRLGHPHVRRDYALQTDTVVKNADSTVIVTVDQNGNVLNKEVQFLGMSAPSPAPNSFPRPPLQIIKQKVPEPAVPVPSPVAKPAPRPAQPAPPNAASPSPGAASRPSSLTTDATENGITYNPYNADGTCMTPEQVSQDFARINGYETVRIYGTDCSQVPIIVTAAKAKNMTVFAGISAANLTRSFSDNQILSQEVDQFAAAAGGDWSVFAGISVGNENVNQGADVGQVTAAVDSVRSLLRGKGYNGSVVIVDTFNAILANPSICEHSDDAAANVHPFFDPNTAATGAADFLTTQIKNLEKACPGKTVVVTETGWPHQGDTNGLAVPSRENQQIVIDSLEQTFGANKTKIFVFSAMDTEWKQDTPATFNAEKWWGLMPQSPQTVQAA